MALTAAIAAVAVPGPVGSRGPSSVITADPDLFANIEVAAAVRGPETTIAPLDPGARSDGTLDERSILIEPAQRTEPPTAPNRRAQPGPAGGFLVKNPWRTDPEISWFGPGFYGSGTACGQTLTKSLKGVAHRTLPCGTLVTFRNGGRVVTLPVVDRGPYVGGRIFDLTRGACVALDHCYTGPIEWKMAKP